ncbi:hypothetical protein EB796_000290 [Bugula neritina]|uniref:Uncharacterized protein n=1 Tax=Bugula neritina TaxID=10212 RepID=A0A7J7KT90_BUGNE|nr:hypothetical protein EB796_000290 [Bugula neritina]
MTNSSYYNFYSKATSYTNKDKSAFSCDHHNVTKSMCAGSRNHWIELRSSAAGGDDLCYCCRLLRPQDAAPVSGYTGRRSAVGKDIVLLSYNQYTSILHSEEAEEAGVHKLTGYHIRYPLVGKEPFYATFLEKCRKLSESEILSVFPSLPHGRRNLMSKLRVQWTLANNTCCITQQVHALAC